MAMEAMAILRLLFRKLLFWPISSYLVSYVLILLFKMVWIESMEEAHALKYKRLSYLPSFCLSEIMGKVFSLHVNFQTSSN